MRAMRNPALGRLYSYKLPNHESNSRIVQMPFGQPFLPVLEWDTVNFAYRQKQ